MTEERNQLYNLAGIWTVTVEDGRSYDMKIPGTLDESNIGLRDALDPEDVRQYEPEREKDPLEELLSEEGLLFEEEEPKEEDVRIRTRYTRKYAYEGLARISRTVTFTEKPGKRLFLEVERARELRLFIDETEIEYYQAPSLSTPHIFEVTGYLNGTHVLTIVSDNRYVGFPREAILASNAASDHTQTNWNGLLGYVRLREEEESFVDSVLVLPSGRTVSLYLEISSKEAKTGTLCITSPALTQIYEETVSLKAGISGFRINTLPLLSDIEKWDEENGRLYELTASLNGAEKTVSFGVRDFEATEKGTITCNYRNVFLRGESDFAVYPETGYAPTDVPSWREILRAYQEYGVNFVRFASHVPPEAAFCAADELGMFLMAELSQEGDRNAFSREEASDYYRLELSRVLRTLGNHPSFVMLSFGTGLRITSGGAETASELLKLARTMDPTRLYSLSSDLSVSSDAQSRLQDTGDFIMASGILGKPLRNIVNQPYLNTEAQYRSAVKMARGEGHYSSVNPLTPMISFEAGQYLMLPDLREIDLFSGFLQPDNMICMREDAKEAGLLPNWNRVLSAGGELALQSFRLEAENAFRTAALSGAVLRGLKDYPGKGGGFYGMMNTHLQKKPFPFADPKRFSAFFGPVLLMASYDRYTYEAGETFRAAVSVFHYGRENLNMQVTCTLTCRETSFTETFEEKRVRTGGITEIGEFETVLPEPGEYLLTLKCGRLANTYPVYVYPAAIPICPESVYEADCLDEKVLQVLSGGKTVFLTPPSDPEYLPESVPAGFSGAAFFEKDQNEGRETSGMMIDTAHPLFENFPTKEYPTLQWHDIALSRAVILPRRMKTVISETDAPDQNRCLARLFEFRLGGGNVLFSSLGLKEKLGRPEVRALLNCIYAYLESYDFSPVQEMKIDEVRRLLKESPVDTVGD